MTDVSSPPAPGTDQSAALVLFSGGQDSTVCLAWALKTYDRVETIGFDYGQRHRIELDQRPRLLDGLRGLETIDTSGLGGDLVLAVPTLKQLGATAMTDEIAFAQTEAGLPNTFVPGRNLIFLTYAAAYAYRRGISTLVGGMCETDYSGYPDCRDETLQALAHALTLGLDSRVAIATPLMWATKAETWSMAEALGGRPLVDLIVGETHTCYAGDRATAHEWGYGCAACPACDLRAKGWRQWRASSRI